MQVSKTIIIFKNSFEFAKLRDSTKKSYELYLEIFQQKFGRHLIINLGLRSTISDIRQFVLTFSDKPRKASYLLAVIKRFYNWSYMNGHIRHNLSDLLSLALYKKPAKENNWQEEDYKYAMQVASDVLKDFFFLATETGLRRCDLIRLQYKHIMMSHKGHYIKICQSKTQKDVFIPLNNKLKIWLLKRMEDKHLQDYILQSSTGVKWSESSFNSCWKRFSKTHNMKHVSPHGLRKLTVTRLINAGCSTAEIGAILGWSIQSVTMMLDNHYFVFRSDVAFNAIKKINNQ